MGIQVIGFFLKKKKKQTYQVYILLFFFKHKRGEGVEKWLERNDCWTRFSQVSGGGGQQQAGLAAARRPLLGETIAAQLVFVNSQDCWVVFWYYVAQMSHKPK